MKTMERNTTAAPIFNDEVEPLKRRNRWLTWLSVALAVALVGFGTWAIVGNDDGAADLTAQQEQMLETIDEYLEAWNNHDGEAAAALMASESSYHDNGTRYFVADGEFADFVSRLTSFSVKSLASDGEAEFVGNYVLTTDYIPEFSTTATPSFFRMTSDGTKIIWHYAP
ncbi:MAG: hypothetical protein ACN4GZ_15465 [Acidimicrobiales bacterium]